MQTPSFLRNGPILIEDEQCAETNEKSNLRFLFFELSQKFIENWGDDVIEMTITRKIKIVKI